MKKKKIIQFSKCRRGKKKELDNKIITHTFKSKRNNTHIQSKIQIETRDGRPSKYVYKCNNLKKKRDFSGIGSFKLKGLLWGLFWRFKKK